MEAARHKNQQELHVHYRCFKSFLASRLRTWQLEFLLWTRTMYDGMELVWDDPRVALSLQGLAKIWHYSGPHTVLYFLGPEICADAELLQEIAGVWFNNPRPPNFGVFYAELLKPLEYSLPMNHIFKSNTLIRADFARWVLKYSRS